MNIEDFIKHFDRNEEFKLDLLKYAEEIHKNRLSTNLSEHKKNLSSLENNLLLALISNEIYPVKKGIHLK